MNINIFCVGKLKEKYWRDAVAEYAKRLGRYANVSVTEVADEKTPDNASAAEEAAIKRKEGERLLKALKKGKGFTVALAIDGKQLSSEQFSAELDRWFLPGKGVVNFVIGGSLGLSDEALKYADAKISFSRLTFPHQMTRVILLEQIYRGFRILKNEPYHK